MGVALVLLDHRLLVAGPGRLEECSTDVSRHRRNLASADGSERAEGTPTARRRARTACTGRSGWSGRALVGPEGPGRQRQRRIARTSRPTTRGRMNDQSGVASKASRPASTAQLTGLSRASVAIQSGARASGMNAADRNVSGRTSSVLMPMTDSRWRSSERRRVGERGERRRRAARRTGRARRSRPGRRRTGRRAEGQAADDQCLEGQAMAS